MPSLVLVKPEAAPAGEYELSGGPHLIGRMASAGCQIVLKNKSVSKIHARVTAENGRFFLTDLESHNHTYLNGTKLEPNTKTALKAGDKIVICDYHLVFHEDDDIPAGAVEVSRNTCATPEARLAALLALSADPARAGDLAPLHGLIAETLFSGTVPALDRIADTLLGVFPQAERCLVLVLDETGWPIPKVTRDRAATPQDTRFCRSLAVRAIELQQSYVADTATGPMWPEVRSVVCVPLTASDGRPLGALLLDTRDRARKFTADDLNLSGIVANLAGVALEKARAQAAIQAREKEQCDLALAQGVQLGFLPQQAPAVSGYEFFSHYSAAQKVGGDYYDFIALHDGRLAVVVADVSGKGVPAALLVAKLSSEVRTCLMRAPDLAKAVGALNRQMIDGGIGELFVTFVVMVLDLKRHTLTVVNAGHPSPKLYRAASGVLTDLIASEIGGQPIGWNRDAAYTAVTVALLPHDTVTAFTDGVTEAMNPADVTFGTDAAERHLHPDSTQGPDAGRPRWVGQSLVGAVGKHRGARPQNDDIAIVGFGRWEPESDHQTTVMH